MQKERRSSDQRPFFCFFCGFIVTDAVFRFRYGLIFALFGGAVVFYGADFFLVVMRGAGHGDNLAALVDLHHANTLAGTCTDANGTGFDTDNHTVICDENDVVIEINDLNGRDIAVSDGAFSFDVPYEAEKNTFALTLTDTETRLTSSYVFCSLGTVSGGFNAATLKLYDEEGNADPEKVSKFEKENERVFHGSSLTDTVRIGFQVLQQGGANSEFYAELVDEAGKVIEKFSLADDKDIQQDIVSKAITLKPGMNWFLLRHYGVDKSKYVDGKPAETPAYRTVAIVVNYNDPTESDATPEGISVWLEGSKGVNRLEGFDGETTEYNVTLPVDGFLLGEGQPVHLALKLKEGQTATVYGGIGI